MKRISSKTSFILVAALINFLTIGCAEAVSSMMQIKAICSHACAENEQADPGVFGGYQSCYNICVANNLHLGHRI